MLTVNLEKELIKQNKSIVSEKELLLIQEYDRVGEIATDTTIQRVFGDISAVIGGRIKQKIDSLLEDTKKFNQDRVFHISQIEKLCKKYHLRFLPSPLFKGRIDKNLPAKISQFEIAYNEVCTAWSNHHRDWNGNNQYTGGNTYVAAPAKSFKLEQKPKDPLLFFQINESYYYLIHKWGNDLSVIRRLYKAASTWAFGFFTVVIPVVLATVLLWANGNKNDTIEGIEIAAIVGTVGSIILTVSHCVSGWIRFAKKNSWRSQFIGD